MFAAEQEDAPARRLALLGDLRHCLERDELVLHYQPKIDLDDAARRSASRRSSAGTTPPGALFMPDEFMPELESN